MRTTQTDPIVVVLLMAILLFVIFHEMRHTEEVFALPQKSEKKSSTVYSYVSYLSQNGESEELVGKERDPDFWIEKGLLKEKERSDFELMILMDDLSKKLEEDEFYNDSPLFNKKLPKSIKRSRVVEKSAITEA